MSDILRQVDEELRQDRIVNVWKRYRAYLIGALILIIGSTLGYQINQSLNQSFYEEIVEKYIANADLKNLDSSIENLSEIEEDNQLLISGIAKIKVASLLMEKGEVEKSRNKLMEIINDDNDNSLIADLAVYFYLMSDLKEIKIEEIKAYITNERLEKSSLKYLFKEVIAINNLLSGNIELSQENFNDLSNDVDTPREIVIRASKFLDIIE